MKVLCPTDFSNASLNACQWITHLLKDEKGVTIYLLHCINLVSRASVFVKTDDVFREVAQRDIKTLKDQLQEIAPGIEINTKVVNHSPKSFTTDFATKENFDLIVTGSKGLSALKEVTVGSVTAYLMEHTGIPILAIPEKASFKGLRGVVLGIDHNGESAQTLAPLVRLLELSDAQLDIIHVSRGDETDYLDNQLLIEPMLEDLSYKFTILPEKDSIPATLTQYCIDSQTDLLAMVHRKRSFLERVFWGSYSREELYIFQIPLLILPQV